MTDTARAEPAGGHRFLFVVLGLAGFAVAVQFVSGLGDIIAPIFLALNLIIVAYPLQATLIRYKVPRFLAAMVTVVVVLLLLVAFFGLTAWSIAELFLVMPDYADELTDTYRHMLEWMSSIGLTPAVIQDQLENFNFASLASAVLPVLSNVYAIVGLLVTAVMAVFFLAMDSMSFRYRVAVVSRIRPRFADALGDFASGVRRYWVVATIFGLIVAVLDVGALMIIGVPLVMVWGVLAFLTNYIPNIGFVIGLVPPAIMALVTGGWWDFAWVVAAYAVLNFVIQSIIQPKFTGESVGVTPFISFLSLLFWVWVLGWLGALLALPATLLVKALLVDADPRARWINTLISSDLSSGNAIPLHPSPVEVGAGYGSSAEASAASSGPARSAAAHGSAAASEATAPATADRTGNAGPSTAGITSDAASAGERISDDTPRHDAGNDVPDHGTADGGNPGDERA